MLRCALKQAGSVHKPPHADVHHNSQRQKGEEDRRSAVAHQRERNARDRHEADDHADVHRDLKDDDRDDSHDDEGTGQVGGSLGVLDKAHED